MTIECYYSECEFHSCKAYPDDGPFCDEIECKATQEQIVEFQKSRDKYLDSLKVVDTVPNPK